MYDELKKNVLFIAYTIADILEFRLIQIVQITDFQSEIARLLFYLNSVLQCTLNNG